MTNAAPFCCAQRPADGEWCVESGSHKEPRRVPRGPGRHPPGARSRTIYSFRLYRKRIPIPNGFEIGAREGAFYVLFSLFGLDPHLGVYTSIVGRVRDFVWIAAGLLLVLVVGSPAASDASAASTAPGR